MKKILSVSILAMLAVAPLTANASNAYPTVTIGTDTATIEEVGDDRTKVATTGYVKGAYNAAIQNLNTERVRVDDINTAIGAKTTGQGVTHNILYKNSDDTIYGNLEKLETAVGALTTDAGNTYVQKSTANAVTNKGTDQTLHYATGDGEHVGANLAALDGAIGDMTGFGNNTYATSTSNVATNLDNLDTAVKDNADHIGTIGSLSNATNLAATDDTLVEGVIALDAKLGTVSAANMGTTAGTVVGAINEIDGTVDGLVTNTTVPTTDTTYIGKNGTSTVSTALKSLDTQVATNTGDISTINGTIGDATMTTTAQTLTGAINEVNSKVLTVYSSWNSGEAAGGATPVSLAKPSNS